MNVLHLFIDLITLAVVLYFIFKPGKYEVWLTTPVSGNKVKFTTVPRVGEHIQSNKTYYTVDSIEYSEDGMICVNCK